MNRYAFTFAIRPETAAAVAGILAYYLPPGATLVKGDRILHVTDTTDDLRVLAVRLSGRSRRAPITRALSGCWRAPVDLDARAGCDGFLAATLMQTSTHHERADRTDVAASGGPIERRALLFPVPAGGDRFPAQLLDSDAAARVTSTVFRNDDIVVWFLETQGEVPGRPPPYFADRAMTLLATGGGGRPRSI